MSHTRRHVKAISGSPLGRAQRKATTQAAIIEAAGRLFAEQGITATSLDAIAAEVGLTKGAVYASFPSKQAVVDAVDANRRMVIAFAPLYREDLPLKARLRELGSNLAAARREVPAHLFLLDLEFYLEALRNRAAGKRLAAIQRTQTDEAVRKLRKTNAARRESTPIPLDQFVQALGAVGRGLVWLFMTSPEAVSDESVATLFELLAGSQVPPAAAGT